MDSERFDAAVKAWATTRSRRRVLGGLLAAAVAGWRPSRMAAQEEIAAAGNGGTVEASANGGAVATGNINGGSNTGNAIGVGDTRGNVAVDGGAAANATDLDIAADGGVGIADASGGDDNVAFDVDAEIVPRPDPPPDPGPPPSPPPPPPPPCTQECIAAVIVDTQQPVCASPEGGCNFPCATTSECAAGTFCVDDGFCDFTHCHQLCAANCTCAPAAA